jgi:hypothetical protein
MSWSNNPLIIRRINDDIKNALQSGNVLSLQNNLSLLSPLNHTNGAQTQQRIHLVKEIEAFIQRCKEEAIRQNNYELFQNAVDLYKTPIMLNDPTARRNYSALIQEFNPKFEKFFNATEQEQPEVLGKIITPITKDNFEAKVAVENENRTLTKPSASTSTR